MNEDKIIQMLLKHGDDIKYIKENMSTKDDVSMMMKILDEIVKLSKKKDQEITMLAHGFTRHGRMLDEHEKIIGQMKPLVGLA